MKRVFISTNICRLREKIIGNRKSELGIDKLGKDTSILYYNFKLEAFDTQSKSSSIVLVYDELFTSIIKTLTIDIKTDCLLHHTSAPKNEKYKQFHHKVEGLHEKADIYLYQPVFEILFDDKENKFERIISVLGFTPQQIDKKQKLEDALDFLHICLGVIDSKKAKALPEDFANCSSCQQSYKDWIESVNNTTLGKLRDSLLIESGIEV